MCFIQNETAKHANASMQVDREELINEMALTDLFTNNQGDFVNGEIEMYEVVDKALDDEEILVKSLLERIATDDLTAVTELKQLLSGMALQKDADLAA